MIASIRSLCWPRGWQASGARGRAAVACRLSESKLRAVGAMRLDHRNTGRVRLVMAMTALFERERALLAGSI
jgi:hypothetical protein